MAEATDPLVIGDAPPAFKEFAEKHNALWRLIRTMEGRGGLTATVANSKIILQGGTPGGELHFNNGLIKIDIDGDGVVLENLTTGEYCWFDPDGRFRYADGTNDVTINPDGLRVNAGGAGKSCEIFFAALSENMSIREIDVCDGGVARKMLVIASAPYGP